MQIRFAAIAAGLIAAVLLQSSVPTFAQNPQMGCQGHREDIMTLTDPNTPDIDPTQIIGVHASALASFPLPADLPDEARFNPYETTIYTTAGNLISATLGPNQEIAVVLADPDTNLSITVVFPDAEHCAQSADTNALQLMEAARQKVVSTLGMPNANGPTPLTGQAIVTGIGFIDQSVAEQGNTGIELAPVLDIQFDSTAAANAPGVTPISTPVASATPQPQASTTATPSVSPPTPSPTPHPQASATPAAGYSHSLAGSSARGRLRAPCAGRRCRNARYASGRR
jgi:hypothetical protein